MERFIVYGSLIPFSLFALPEGADVASGAASFSQPAPHTLVIEASDKAVVNYRAFNIGEEESVRFVQPHARATVLNRVQGSNPSSILGKLHSNGKVFLINPSGIFFGPHSQVNVGSLIASTLDIEDKDFLAGNYKFKLHPDAKQSKIIHRGQMQAGPEGQIALLAPHISNEGVISAVAGSVGLIAGSAITLDFAHDGLMKFVVAGELESAIIEHLGKISASQAEVFLKLATADSLIKSVINSDGVVEGRSLVRENGEVHIVSKNAFDAKNIKLSGSSVKIEAPISCHSLEIDAQKEILVGGDLKTNNTPLVFNAPVLITAPHVTISTGALGSDLIFEKEISPYDKKSASHLTLTAGRGTLFLGGDVGGKIPFASFTAAGSVIDQNGQIRTSGPISYRGKIYLGGKVSTTGSNIIFNGDVIRDHIDTVLVSSGKGRGDIIFKGKVDADQETRSLQIRTGEGKVVFEEPIGAKGPFTDLTIYAAKVGFDNIGAEKPGVLHQLYVSAKDDVQFNGRRIYATDQSWISPQYKIAALQGISFISDGRPIDFSQGTLLMADAASISIDTHGGDLTLFGLKGEKSSLINLSAEEGKILIGGFEIPRAELTVRGRKIEVTADIFVDSLDFSAHHSIMDQNDGAKLVVNRYARCLAKQGNIGSKAMPFVVHADLGKIDVGAKVTAYIVGTSYDGLVHPIHGYRPDVLSFNGYEYVDMVFEDFIYPVEEEILSIAPDLFMGSKGNYLDPKIIKPRRGLLFYTR